jgi:hypothetical protein
VIERLRDEGEEADRGHGPPTSLKQHVLTLGLLVIFLIGHGWATVVVVVSVVMLAFKASIAAAKVAAAMAVAVAVASIAGV